MESGERISGKTKPISEKEIFSLLFLYFSAIKDRKNERER
jgi:hypothetical protein